MRRHWFRVATVANTVFWLLLLFVALAMGGHE